MTSVVDYACYASSHEIYHLRFSYAGSFCKKAHASSPRACLMPSSHRLQRFAGRCATYTMHGIRSGVSLHTPWAEGKLPKQALEPRGCFAGRSPQARLQQGSCLASHSFCRISFILGDPTQFSPELGLGRRCSRKDPNSSSPKSNSINV